MALAYSGRRAEPARSASTRYARTFTEPIFIGDGQHGGKNSSGTWSGSPAFPSARAPS